MTVNTSGEKYEPLYLAAIEIIDSVKTRFGVDLDWRWGGGTAMMLRHRHRHSFDIDIFVDDPQTLGYISPRLNDTSENFSSHYIEQGGFVKMFLPDGEVDFIVAPIEA